MINIKNLREFLIEAKKSTYASGDAAHKVKEYDKSTTLVFESGDFKYHDNYFGGEPFGGREVVFFKGAPIYIMTYYGLVNKAIADCNGVYRVLQHALSLIPENKPYRGPNEYVDGAYIYLNKSIGEIDDFSGEEIIKLDGREIYRARYVGGLVDQR
ncbi:MAG: DUF5680 domain-containing protein [Candidatus Falkowbacteria bacterium]